MDLISSKVPDTLMRSDFFRGKVGYLDVREKAGWIFESLYPEFHDSKYVDATKLFATLNSLHENCIRVYICAAKNVASKN